MPWGTSGGGAGQWVMVGVLLTVIVGGLTALAVWVALTLRKEPRDASGYRADALLAERFAKGDIDGEEFTHSRDLLHSAGSHVLPGNGNPRPAGR